MLDLVFNQRKYTIQFAGIFRLFKDPAKLQLPGDTGFPLPANSIWNPHIVNFRCAGSHESAIRNALNDANYMLAIEQCIYATKNLNTADGVVTNRFISILQAMAERNIVSGDAHDDYAKCFRDNDTLEYYTPAEVIRRHQNETYQN